VNRITAPNPRLEAHSKRKLKDALRVQEILTGSKIRSSDLPECGAQDIRVGIGELGVVEYVESFQPEFGVQTFGNGRGFGHGQIAETFEYGFSDMSS